MNSTLCWKDIPGSPDRGTVLANLADLPDGGALLLTLETGQAPFKIILLRSGELVFAYVNRCAHFGVPLAAKPEYLYAKPHESITCSVHYARYRWQDGVCDHGECIGDSLLPIPVVVIGDEIVVASEAA